MATARIFRNQPPGPPILHKDRPSWVLEWWSDRPARPDPLTGWTGGSEPQAYVRITFPTKEAAIAYCERQGYDFVFQPEPPRKLRLQNYADNFR